MSPFKWWARDSLSATSHIVGHCRGGSWNCTHLIKIASQHWRDTPVNREGWIRGAGAAIFPRRRRYRAPRGPPNAPGRALPEGASAAAVGAARAGAGARAAGALVPQPLAGLLEAGLGTAAVLSSLPGRPVSALPSCESGGFCPLGAGRLGCGRRRCLAARRAWGGCPPLQKPRGFSAFCKWCEKIPGLLIAGTRHPFV